MDDHNNKKSNNNMSKYKKEVALVMDTVRHSREKIAHDRAITDYYTANNFQRFRERFPHHPDPSLWPKSNNLPFFHPYHPHNPYYRVPILYLYDEKCGLPGCRICHRMIMSKI